MRCSLVLTLVVILLPSAEAAASWQRALCPKTHRPYYFNRETREVSWKRPTGVAEHVPEGTEAAFEELPLAVQQRSSELPAIFNNILPIQSSRPLAFVGKCAMVGSVFGVTFALL